MDIAVGLSGGVDSSVAAYLLKKEGHNVKGLWMDILGNPKAGLDAKKVADFLGIPFYVIDISKEYRKEVINYIKNEYSSGKTPNPCVVCNHKIKFGALLTKALDSGIPFDYFATGHYSILERDEVTDRILLKRGKSTDKDQAYFLSMLEQEQLKKLLFPLGGMNKKDVKTIAEKLGLFTSSKKESQDLCTGNYRDFIVENKGSGYFIDTDGNILGRHKGIENYTIGQRRGLGISSTTLPYYVVKIVPDENSVMLGFDSDLTSKKMIVTDLNWISVSKPLLPNKVICKIRYRDNGSPAVLKYYGDNSCMVIFDEPRRAITPGQVAVFYQDEIVLGAGIISVSM